MVDFATRAELPGLQRFGPRAQEAILVDVQVLEAVLRLCLRAAEVDAFRTGVVNVYVVKLHVAHGGCAVIVGFCYDSGELGARDFQHVELEVSGFAADAQAGEPCLTEGVVADDPVATLAVSVGAVGMPAKRGVACLGDWVIAPSEYPVAAAIDDEQLAGNPACRVAGQKGYDVGDVLRLSQPAKACLKARLFKLVGRGPAQDVGARYARQNGVHGDAALTCLL